MESPLLATAMEVAKGAGAIVQSMLHDPRASKGVRSKRSPGDLVTRADRMAEDYIVEHLRNQFPTHGILAEEGSRSDGAYRWIIDPLDGTSNFSFGIPWFAISLALEYQGELLVGVVYHPSQDELFAAERGKGARVWRAEQVEPLHVSEAAQMSEAVVATGRPFAIREVEATLRRLPAVARSAMEVRMMGSAALHLAYVAAGRIAAFWEPGLNPWDVAGGRLLVEEAGGMVTDLEGNPFRPDGSDILASNGRIHQHMVRLLAAR